jgi:uncharacterized protein involved in exopolysaccharide biosynthesis
VFARVALCGLRASAFLAFLIPVRCAASIGKAYVTELNRLVAELSTSSARRERVLLEERLKDVSQNLEAAEKEFSQFSGKNTATGGAAVRVVFV